MGNARRIKRAAAQNARKRAAAAAPAPGPKSSRNWTKWILGGGIAAAAILLVVFISVDVSSNPQETPDPPDGIEVVATEGLLPDGTVESSPTHFDTAIVYSNDPPTGGPHNPTPLRCQVYDEPVASENAVHALEHGAVWIAYDPDQVGEDDADALGGFARQSEVIVSPYPGLDSPIHVVSWGRMMTADSADDERIDLYVRSMKNVTAPEPAAGC